MPAPICWPWRRSRALRKSEALLDRRSATLGVPAWLSMTCADGRTRAGEPAEDAFRHGGGVDSVIAVGVNCVDSVEAAIW